MPIIIGVAALVFAADQLTKYWVVQNIPLYGWWSFTIHTGRLFRIIYVTNSGAALGVFPQLGTIFMVIAIVVVVGILIFHRRLPVESPWVRLALGLQLGGALGNLTDRLVRGSVVDFVDIGFWPIFNLADVAIVVGVAILAYYFWEEEKQLNAAKNNSL
ncbi:MAG: signal peptidase II [Chloroflexi bacterium]|nr:MAG: signal peptidase II [Chloroflexota bacterium]